MAYPTDLDSFTTRSNGQVIDAAHVNALQTATAALEAKVGVNASAVPAALDYKMAKRPLAYLNQGASTRTSRSFATKGCTYTPSANQTLYGIRTILATPTSGYTITAYLITVSAGAIATIVTAAETYTAPTSTSNAALDFLFSSGQALASGTTYGLMIGLNSTGGSATSTTDLPLFVTRRTALEFQLPRAGTFGSSSYHVASLAPVVSTSVTTATNDQDSGHACCMVTPIFEWA